MSLPAKLTAYFRRHHVGYLALLVALGGTAYAVTDDSISSRHIRDGQVKPPDLGLVKVVERPGPDSISATGGGITQDFKLRVPAPGLVAIHASAEIQQGSSSGNCLVSVRLPGTDTEPLINRGVAANSFTPMESAPGSRDEFGEAGTNAQNDGGWVVFKTDTGLLEGELVLSRVLSTTCGFRSIELYLMPLT